MTLEQIRNRQYQINDNLYSLLQNTQGVVMSIVGEQPLQDAIDGTVCPAGFLGDISLAQDRTERLIGEIQDFNKLLIENTYAPSEPLCTSR